MTSPESSKLRAAGREAPLLDGLALLLTPWTILVQGHRFGLGNHDTLLSFIRRLNDPAYLVNDWMLSTPPVHPQMTHLLAALCDRAGEPGAFLLAQFATRLILLMGIWRLVLALLPGRTLVAVLAMAGSVLEPRFHLGGHYLQGGHWEPAFLGMAFAVWIIALGIEYAEGRGSWIGLSLAAGLGIFSHFFITLPVFFVVVAGVVWRRRDWREVTKIVALALFLGAPSWAGAVKGFFLPDAAPLTGREVISVLQFRHPHHHQPWTWPVADFVQCGLLLVAGAVAWSRLLTGNDRRRLLIPALLLGYFVMSCTAFWICGRLQVLPVLAYLQPFRLLSLFLLSIQIAVLAVAGRVLPARSTWLLVVTGVGLLLLMRLTNVWGALVVALNLGFLALQMRPENAPAREELVVGRGMRLALTIAGFLGIALLQWNDSLQALVNRIHPEHWRARVEPNSSARAQLAEWIGTHTSPSDVFAIPPNMGYFRIWEKRAVVVDMKNVPYRNADLKEWGERISLASNGLPFRAFSTPPESDPPPHQLAVLADTYKARYVLIRGKIGEPHDLYPGPDFTILDLQEVEIVASRRGPASPLRQVHGPSTP